MNRIDAQIERLDRICDGIRAVLPAQVSRAVSPGAEVSREHLSRGQSADKSVEYPANQSLPSPMKAEASERQEHPPTPLPLAERNVGAEPRRAGSAQGRGFRVDRLRVEPGADETNPVHAVADVTKAARGLHSAETPTAPIPDFGRPLGRAKTYTATIAWDPIGREWYGLCGLCKGDLGSISDADIGHYVTCDCCATDNFIERED